jgi:hypothetical protein
MARGGEQTAHRSFLNHPTGVHHRHSFSDLDYRGQVMADKHQGDPEVVGNAPQQPQMSLRMARFSPVLRGYRSLPASLLLRPRRFSRREKVALLPS